MHLNPPNLTDVTLDSGEQVIKARARAVEITVEPNYVNVQSEWSFDAITPYLESVKTTMTLELEGDYQILKRGPVPIRVGRSARVDLDEVSPQAIDSWAKSLGVPPDSKFTVFNNNHALNKDEWDYAVSHDVDWERPEVEFKWSDEL